MSVYLRACVYIYKYILRFHLAIDDVVRLREERRIFCCMEPEASEYDTKVNLNPKLGMNSGVWLMGPNSS